MRRDGSFPQRRVVIFSGSPCVAAARRRSSPGPHGRRRRACFFHAASSNITHVAKIARSSRVRRLECLSLSRSKTRFRRRRRRSSSGDLDRLRVDRFRSRRHFFAAAPSEETKSTRVFRESIPQNPLSYSARASLSACSASSMSPAIFFRSNGESYFFRGTPFAPTKNLT